MSGTLRQGSGANGAPSMAPAGRSKPSRRDAPDWTAVAREHLAKLQEAQRPPVGENPERPSSRPAGRRLRREWTRVRAAIERLRRRKSPQYALGRVLAHMGLLRRPPLKPVLVALVGGALVAARFTVEDTSAVDVALIVYAAVQPVVSHIEM